MNSTRSTFALALARAGLVSAVLAAGLVGTLGTALADQTPPQNPPGLIGQPGHDGNQGNQGNNGNQANQGNKGQAPHQEEEDAQGGGNGGAGSLWHRRAFSGIVTNVKANGSGRGFDLLLRMGGEEHTIAVSVDGDTAYRGGGHGDVEDADMPADAFFALLMDLHDNSGTDVRANVRGALSEDNGKLKLLAAQVSLHEVEDGEDNA